MSNEPKIPWYVTVCDEPDQIEYRIVPYMTVAERGEIKGEVYRVGGIGDPVPVLVAVAGRTISGCWARRTIAKPLAQKLFGLCASLVRGDGSGARKASGR